MRMSQCERERAMRDARWISPRSVWSHVASFPCKQLQGHSQPRTIASKFFSFNLPGLLQGPRKFATDNIRQASRLAAMLRKMTGGWSSAHPQ